MAASDEIRQQIVSRARRKECRIHAFSDLRPCVWQPESVINEHGFAFTSESAWNFVADCVEDGEALEELKLEHPPGEIAYVMKILLPDAHARIYIKVQLLGNSILGRSFHYSTES